VLPGLRAAAMGRYAYGSRPASTHRLSLRRVRATHRHLRQVGGSNTQEQGPRQQQRAPVQRQGQHHNRCRVKHGSVLVAPC
jgi:hypothetical protein